MRDYDHGTKFAHYRRLASLVQYVLVDPTDRTVESFVRKPDNTWRFTDCTGSGRITFDPIDLSLDLEQIFADLQ